jgi:hypothetical protein
MSHDPSNVATKDSETPSAHGRPPLRNVALPLLMVCVIVAAILGIVMYFLSPRSTSTPPGPAVRPGAGLVARPGNWVLARSSLDNLLSSYRSIATRTYDRPHVYITAPVWSRNPVPASWHSVPTVDFKSYAAFSAAVRHGTMPGWARAVLYDPEAWPQTPAQEQIHVAYYMRRFAQLAHQHDWTVILMPGTDLMNVYPKLPSETNAHAFIRFNIAGAAAHYADISVTQSQSLELNPVQYRRFLLKTHSQALAANPGVLFLGGLTVNVLGRPVPPQALYDATSAARSVVSGFVIYVSRTTPGPANAGQYLRALAAAGDQAPAGRPAA